MNWTELKERLAAASGPSRELDAYIDQNFGERPGWREHVTEFPANAKFYTFSFDAAQRFFEVYMPAGSEYEVSRKRCRLFYVPGTKEEPADSFALGDVGSHDDAGALGYAGAGTGVATFTVTVACGSSA